jgi:hypothetical protein
VLFQFLHAEFIWTTVETRIQPTYSLAIGVDGLGAFALQRKLLQMARIQGLESLYSCSVHGILLVVSD